MGLNIAGFRRTKNRLSLIYDMCSLARFDPATTPARLAEIAAYEAWVCRQRYDQGHPNGILHDEVSRRAYAIFGHPDLLIGVSLEDPAPMEAAS